MYKITEAIADYLLTTRKNPQIPGLLKDDLKPFVQRNTHTIGLITPFLVSESDSRYLVEIDIPMTDDPAILENTSNQRWWLYKRNEMQRPNDSLELKRSSVDRYWPNEDDMIDVADCCLEVPEHIVKEQAIVINSLQQLFEFLPDLKDCLDPEQEKHYGNVE